MVERIFQELSRTDFDFRKYAYPADPLSNLFDEWVPYYRLKHAIAKALRPDSILEIGVRFGCSAMAFLTAASLVRAQAGFKPAQAVMRIKSAKV